MAVEVEDHPVAYASFEGRIPKGAYGGGHVAVFDKGVWATEDDAERQIAKGHLRFELFGDKLKGSWHLVRSGKSARKPQWLLFKGKDEYAGTLEADDLLADVTPAPEADIRRAGGGKEHKQQLKAMPVARPSRKDWAGKALKLPKAKQAKLKNAAFAPQLARLGDAPPEGEQWLHEFKWDGYRLVTTIVDGKVRIWSRNAIEWTDKLPEIRAAIERLGLVHAALDGELIAGQGRQQDFNLLQATLSGEQQGALAYVLFDLLHVNGVDLDQAPLSERKALLQELLAKPVPHLGYSSHVEGDGQAAFALAAERKFEGIISKRGDRPYHPGRGDDWRKTKALDSDEFAVVGYTPAKGSRSGFGSLLLARPDSEHGWVYAGRVGSGFSNQLIDEVMARIGKAGGTTPTVHIAGTKEAELRKATWFAPMFVVETFIRGISTQGVLRQPSLKAVRLDKDVADLGDSDRATARKSAAKGAAKMAAKTAAAKTTSRRTATATAKAASTSTAKAASKPATKRAVKATTTAAAKVASRSAARKTAQGKAATKATARPAAKAARSTAKPAGTSATRSAATKKTGVDTAPGGFRLTSPARVVYEESGITKLDVANYYLAVMDHLLPEIADRPLSVIRCPDGTGKACFFQKHHTAGMKAVGAVRLREESGKDADYLLVDEPESVMELVQFSALEFHPWGAKAGTPDKADRIVFDLDPGEGVPFGQVKSAARQLRDFLAELDLVSFLRTSGGKGLHVVVPLKPAVAWTTVKAFAHAVAVALAKAEPDRFLSVSTLKLRPGKIFVDYLRNGRGATSVASYSLRVRPGAPVALPLAWDELGKLRTPDAFTLRNVPAKLKRRTRDPWESIDSIRQGLARWKK